MTTTINASNSGSGGLIQTADASGVLALQTAGTTALTVDTSQNVGIGTTSPGQKLEVAGNVLLSNNQYLGVKDSTGAATGFPIFTGSNDAIFGYLASGTTGISTYQFRTGNNSERMRIDSSGNVLVGTTSSSGKLTVSDSAAETKVAINNTGTGGLNWWIGSTNNSSGAVGGGKLAFYDQTSNAARMVIDSSGNVGIGTTSPGSFKLSVNGTASGLLTRVTDGVAQSYDVGTTSTGVYFNTPNTGYYAWQTNSTERMRITSSGTVLYATTTGPYNSGQFGSGYGTSYWTWGPQSGTGSFLVQNGSGATGVYLSAGNTSWSSTSDENLKNITGTIQNGIEKVATLRAAEFTWKLDTTNKPQVGLIAQDIQKILPEVIDTDSEGHLSVRYTEVIPLLVAAIQEQQALITSLTARIAALEGTPA